MIKLSDLKAGISNSGTLTSLYLGDNEIDTIAARNLKIKGNSALEIVAPSGLIVADGSEGTIGDTLSAIDGYGRVAWLPPFISSLQVAYQENNFITTDITHGPVEIGGTEALVVSATRFDTIVDDVAITAVDRIKLDGYDILLESNNILIKDGAEGTSGHVWTSINSQGQGRWLPPVFIAPNYNDFTRPPASSVLKGTIIFNDDGYMLNVSDGYQWRDAMGNLI